MMFKRKGSFWGFIGVEDDECIDLGAQHRICALMKSPWECTWNTEVNTEAKLPVFICTI